MVIRSFHVDQSEEFVGRTDCDGAAREVGCVPSHQVPGACLNRRVKLYRVFEIVDAIVHRQIQ